VVQPEFIFGGGEVTILGRYCRIADKNKEFVSHFEVGYKLQPPPPLVALLV